jgi:hypothetical protein
MARVNMFYQSINILKRQITKKKIQGHTIITKKKKHGAKIKTSLEAIF